MKRSAILALAITGLIQVSLAASVTADPWLNFWRKTERGSGNLVSESRDLEPFQRIRLDGSVDLIVTVGEDQLVTVTADDNLLDNIITEVVGRHTLLVDTEGSYHSSRGIQAAISLPSLDGIEVDGSGNVEISRFTAESFTIEIDGSGSIEFGGKVDELEISLRGSGDVTAVDLASERVNVELHGSGDVEMRGQTQTVDISVHGSGEVDARRLRSDDAHVRIHGSGDTGVYASEKFDGAIFGSGDVAVYGDPRRLTRHVSGSGEISRH